MHRRPLCPRLTAAPALALRRNHNRNHNHFSTTPRPHQPLEPTHYEVLRVAPTATPAELKKQFYVLSKETHPDINRDRPDAAHRFAQLSEAYSTLSHPDKRARYDRDLARTRPRSSAAAAGGAGAQGTYAGSRPATGLSKRRSVFKGPPPSYSGGAGRAQAHGAAASSSSSSSEYQAGTFNAGAYSGGPAGGADFDARGVLRTQTVEDTRRNARRAAEMAALQAEAEEEGNFWARFLVVSGVVILGVSVGTIMTGLTMNKRGGLVRADGSRRGEAKNDWTKG